VRPTDEYEVALAFEPGELVAWCEGKLVGSCSLQVLPKFVQGQHIPYADKP